MAKLCDYATSETIRTATPEEQRASIEASARDGGAGVIEVDGVRCYVETEAGDIDSLSSVLDDAEKLGDDELFNVAYAKYDTAVRLKNRT